MYSVKVKTAVATELVTVDDLKDYLRIDSSDEDALLTALAKQCIRRIEAYCGVSIGTQTRVWTWDTDGEEEEIPYGPVQSITTAKYLSDTSTVPVTYDAATEGEQYVIDGEDFKTIEPLYGTRWKLEYNAGYTTLPDDLKLAILSEAAYRYENRGDGTQKFASENPGLSESAKILANPYRRVLL